MQSNYEIEDNYKSSESSTYQLSQNYNHQYQNYIDNNEQYQKQQYQQNQQYFDEKEEDIEETPTLYNYQVQQAQFLQSLQQQTQYQQQQQMQQNDQFLQQQLLELDQQLFKEYCNTTFEGQLILSLDNEDQNKNKFIPNLQQQNINSNELLYNNNNQNQIIDTCTYNISNNNINNFQEDNQQEIKDDQQQPIIEKIEQSEVIVKKQEQSTNEEDTQQQKYNQCNIKLQKINSSTQQIQQQSYYESGSTEIYSSSDIKILYSNENLENNNNQNENESRIISQSKKIQKFTKQSQQKINKETKNLVKTIINNIFQTLRKKYKIHDNLFKLYKKDSIMTKEEMTQFSLIIENTPLQFIFLNEFQQIFRRIGNSRRIRNKCKVAKYVDQIVSCIIDPQNFKTFCPSQQENILEKQDRKY